MRQGVEKEIVMVEVSQKKVCLIVGWPNKDGRRRLGQRLITTPHAASTRLRKSTYVQQLAGISRSNKIHRNPNVYCVFMRLSM